MHIYINKYTHRLKVFKDIKLKMGARIADTSIPIAPRPSAGDFDKTQSMSGKEGQYQLPRKDFTVMTLFRRFADRIILPECMNNGRNFILMAPSFISAIYEISQ